MKPHIISAPIPAMIIRPIGPKGKNTCNQQNEITLQKKKQKQMTVLAMKCLPE